MEIFKNQDRKEHMATLLLVKVEQSLSTLSGNPGQSLQHFYT